MTRKIGQALSSAALLLLIGALFCGLSGPAYWATTVNDWALDKQYTSARAGADLLQSELVYRRHMMTSACDKPNAKAIGLLLRHRSSCP